eukprot:gene15317-20642_t
MSRFQPQGVCNGACYDAIGLDDLLLRREFGRERGLNPTPTEAQKAALDKLSQKLAAKSPQPKQKKIAEQVLDDEEVLVSFDLKSKTRIILFDGRVLKRNTSSLMQHSVRRHLFLLNDVVLITSYTISAGSLVNFSNDKLNLHQVFQLDQIAIADMCNNSKDEDPAAFELRTSDRTFQFVAESENDKKIWLEELESAIFCIVGSKSNSLHIPGWQHSIVRATFHSSAMHGELEILSYHIERNRGRSLEIVDEAGMTPLHWACFYGKFEAVQLLVEAGSDIDYLNSGLNSSLMLAAASGYDDIVFYLIDNYADVFLRNLKDNDALFMAVLYGFDSPGLGNMITALNIKGVDLNKMDSSGSTSLHECAARIKPRPIQFLVDAGADVNIKHGRTGLTPLQVACATVSSINIDDSDTILEYLETIRSFLDKGAHPNWRDNSKRSAFDIVLDSQKSKHALMFATLNEKSSGKVVDKERLITDDYSLITLPALNEIVKKGGRYTEESIAEIPRPSFKNLIASGRSSWLSLGQPEGFIEFVKANYALISKSTSNWTSDSASNFCLLCLDKFTYGNRRHHCRYCGILCCDLCSTKRLNLKSVDDAITLNSPTKAKATLPEERVCDGCYNKLSFHCNLWQQSVNKSRKEMIKFEANLISNANISSSTKTINSSKDSPIVANINNAKNNVFSETTRALEERGSKIQEVTNRAEQHHEAATEFQKMTSSLLKQQKQKLGGWI